MAEKIDATKSLTPPVRCADCGRFILYADIAAGLCKFNFEPDNYRGPEVADWSCPKCSQKDRKGGS